MDVEEKTAAGRKIKQLLAQRKSHQAEIAGLKAELARVKQHNEQLLSDSRLGPAQIVQKAAQLAGHINARKDAEAGRTKILDFNKRVVDALNGHKPSEEANGIQLPAHVLQTLLDRPDGHKIAAHLIRNPATAREVVALQPHLAAAKIGELGHLLATPQRPRSKAPAPVEEISGGEAADFKPKDYKTYKALRESGRL